MKNSIIKILSDYGLSYSDSAIEKLIDVWKKQKKDLHDLLLKHQNWQESEQAIIFECEDSRELDVQNISSCMYDLMAYIKDNININDDAYNNLLRIKRSPYQFVDENLVCVLADCKEAKIGQKTSRLINSICKKEGADKLENYNKLFALVADAYNPIKIKRTSVLSIHPCDFLTMSSGTGWRSCHSLDEGEYIAGTLSYMCDPVSMIFYTVDSEEQKTELYSLEKITREVFCYQDNVIMQSRLYPNNNEQKKDYYRSIIQKIFSECLNIPNLWRKDNEVDDYVETYSGSLHYPDYEHDCYEANVSIVKGFEPKDTMTIGYKSLCLQCSSQITDQGDLYCDSCSNRPVLCANCDYEMDRDDALMVDGSYYCSECAFLCYECGELEVVDDGVETENGLVCQRCSERYYNYCDICELYVRDDIICVNDIYYCGSCSEDHVVQCDECEEYIAIDDANQHDGNFYCNECEKSIIDRECENNINEEENKNEV